MRLTTKLSAGLFWLLAAVSLAKASPFLWISDASGRIGIVDVANGAATIVGNAGVLLTDIAFDPAGNLWGVSFTNLYTVNRTTGVATNRGPLGVNGMNALVFASNGTLYGASSTSTNLYSINTTTGAATSLGSTGFVSAGDLAFHGGNLYLSSSTSQLVRVDIANPASSAAVGPIGFADVFGLATADNNVLYGATGNQVISVDPATGQGTSVATYAGGLQTAYGTAFVTEAGAPPGPGPGPGPAPGSSAPIPTLSQWSLILLGLMLAAIALGSGRLRRR
jgi:hypothetical protein